MGKGSDKNEMLRFYAAHAMSGLLANGHLNKSLDADLNLDEMGVEKKLAELSFKIANAMRDTENKKGSSVSCVLRSGCFNKH
jgi:hypothetical protein